MDKYDKELIVGWALGIRQTYGYRRPKDPQVVKVLDKCRNMTDDEFMLMMIWVRSDRINGKELVI